MMDAAEPEGPETGHVAYGKWPRCQLVFRMPWTSFCTRMGTRRSRGMPSARHAGCTVRRPASLWGGGFVGPFCAALACQITFHKTIASGDTTRIVQQRSCQPEIIILSIGLRLSAG